MTGSTFREEGSFIINGSSLNPSGQVPGQAHSPLLSRRRTAKRPNEGSVMSNEPSATPKGCNCLSAQSSFGLYFFCLRLDPEDSDIPSLMDRRRGSSREETPPQPTPCPPPLQACGPGRALGGGDRSALLMNAGNATVHTRRVVFLPMGPQCGPDQSQAVPTPEPVSHARRSLLAHPL